MSITRAQLKLLQPPVYALTRKDIFLLVKDKLRERTNNGDEVLEELENAISKILQRPFALSDASKKQMVDAQLFPLLYAYCDKFKWEESTFFTRFTIWLRVFVSFEESLTAWKCSNVGRPSLEDSESSGSETEKLPDAAQMSLPASGNLDAAKVIPDVTPGSPSNVEQCTGSIGSISETPLSPEAALSVTVETNLSKSQYQKIRKASRENCSTLFPSYNKVEQAMLKCFPTKSDICVTECSAEVKLQALLDHTIERILLTQTDAINGMPYEKAKNLNLICQWGCDGTSGPSTFKQEFTDDDGSKSDANIFVASLVPLQLVSVDQETQNTFVVWKNPRPSSPRFCRPIRIQFFPKNSEAIVNEMALIKKQETNLVPYETVVNARTISVSFKLAFTIIDGKVCDAITDTKSAQRCYLCKASSEDFNNIDAMLKKEIDGDHLEFGLSTLDAWIQFFECCLQVGYKLDIKKMQAFDENDKESVKTRKEGIRKGFRLRLGLTVDQPNSGFGSSNDGSTARQFFEHSNISASITGVNENLIKRFHVILQALSSGHKINSIKFQEYALKTALEFVNLYPWCHMPTAVHKVLMHGTEIINSALLPIGQMSEDAQMFSNKCRTDFTRKRCRVKTMEELLSRLLLRSDPYISSLRKLPCKKFKSLLPEAVKLLTLPNTLTSKESSIYSLVSESDDSSDDEY